MRISDWSSDVCSSDLARLARQISAANTRDGTLPVVMLSPEWETVFAESLIGNGEDRQLAMAPTALKTFISAVRDSYDRLAAQGELPCLLTSPNTRPYLRSIVERVRPARSEEHTSELQSLMRTSYAVFCLK